MTKDPWTKVPVILLMLFSSWKIGFTGLHSTYKYCDKYGIPYKKCGKLVVATNDLEVKRLRDLFDRATQNQVPDIELIKGPEAIRKREPNCQGLEALWSPHTGIVDWAQVAKMYGTQFEARGGKIHLGFEVSSFDENSNRFAFVQLSFNVFLVKRFHRKPYHYY